VPPTQPAVPAPLDVADNAATEPTEATTAPTTTAPTTTAPTTTDEGGPAARLQAQLSTKSGGVGLRSTLTHSSAAYVASATSFGPALTSVHTQHAITELNSITNAKLTLLDIKLKKYQQNHLSSLIESVQFKKLNDMLDTANKARLESVSAQQLQYG
jgi:heme-binding NEAT domain protein